MKKKYDNALMNIRNNTTLVSSASFYNLNFKVRSIFETNCILGKREEEYPSKKKYKKFLNTCIKKD